MSMQSLWFGPRERPIFGWLHVPKRAIGGVVLCPPFGIEALCAHYAYRELADRLEQLDLVVLRFDYTATGDSAGDIDDLISTDSWSADIALAMDEVRKTGVQRIGVVGLRLGATLAVSAAGSSGPPDALVLWDACEQGRRFLREQRVLATTIGRTETSDASESTGLELPGVLLSPALAEAVRALDIGAEGGKLGQRVLVLERPNRPASPRFRDRLASENVEWGFAPEQEDFIDVQPGWAILPASTIEHIVEWLHEALDGPDVQPEPPLQDAMGAVTIHLNDELAEISERSVLVGQRNLFGILAEPTTIRDGAPSVVFINAGILPHSGPARIWVDLARRWAASGARVLRVDLSGIGDSPTPAGSPANLPYPIEAIEDTTEAAQFMAPDDPAGVVLVGLCSGAYHVLETATRLASRHAWLINPGSPMTLTSGEGGARDPRRQAVRPLNPLTRRLRQIDPLVQAVNSLMPPAVWWVLDKVRLYPSPAGALDSLARLGTEMILICGDEEADRYMKRSLLTMRRLQRLRAFRFERVPGMDHSLFGRQGRLSAIRLLDAQIGEQLL